MAALPFLLGHLRGERTDLSRSHDTIRLLFRSLVLPLLFAAAASLAAQPYDLVVANGRVLDPATNLDGIRYVAIQNGRIAAISRTALRGKRTIDARGLVVAPGFIDIHSHGQTPENYR